MRPWFIWRGQDSRAMGVIVQDYPPITLPAERVESLIIPGRAGILTRTEGEAVYDTYLKSITIANDRLRGDPQQIAAWLRGSGELIIGAEPEFVYTARVIKEASMKRLFPGCYSGSVGFLVQPFKARAVSTRAIQANIASGSLSLFNPGDVPACPVLAITGSGLLEVTVNGEDGTTIYVNVGENGTGALVDVDAMMVTDPDVSTTLNYSASVSANGFSGLRLRRGANTITWGEHVTGLTVTPHWRWL